MPVVFLVFLQPHVVPVSEQRPPYYNCRGLEYEMFFLPHLICLFLVVVLLVHPEDDSLGPGNDIALGSPIAQNIHALDVKFGFKGLGFQYPGFNANIVRLACAPILKSGVRIIQQIHNIVFQPIVFLYLDAGGIDNILSLLEPGHFLQTVAVKILVGAWENGEEQT